MVVAKISLSSHYTPCSTYMSGSICHKICMALCCKFGRDRANRERHAAEAHDLGISVQGAGSRVYCLEFRVEG